MMRVYDQEYFKMVRRVMPSIIAGEIIGVSPFSGPCALLAESWCPKGMWVRFNRFVLTREQDYLEAWGRNNLEYGAPLSYGTDNNPDAFLFESAADALLFWMRFR